MTKNKTLKELTAIWLSLKSEYDRIQFVDNCSIKEVVLLDRAGYLNWTSLTQ